MLYLFGGKDTIFPRNFQGFWEKCRDEEKEKNRRLPETRAAYNCIHKMFILQQQ